MHFLVFNVWDAIRAGGWNEAINNLRDGLVLGALYSLVALGYTMVYGILKLLNFAHGDVFMIGAFMGFGMLTVLGGPVAPVLGLIPLLIVTFAVAMLGSGVLGVVIERFAYRPLRNAPRIAPLISALGVVFFLESSVQLLTNSAHSSYYTYFITTSLYTPAFTIGGHTVSYVQLLVVVTAFVLMIALTLLVSKTRLGKAMRATAFDREAASMMGIDTDRVISATFFIGSLLAGAAGVMYALYLGDVYFFVGFLYGLKAFTAAVVGGIGSIPGAMLGGLVVGLVEVNAGAYGGGQWKDIAVFGILIAFLLVRPNGLLGSKAIQKV